uniref:Uncharacterized protein n=1 Tax=Myotis myotis TaxID=51298 RepID=A0A7J7Z4Q1_MYOMY|nr:hypothetical protein mMyoMyo1_010608 [Myotis myotis]
MWRQINRPQMREQEKSPEKELNEMKANKLPDTEFKAMVIRMIQEHSENFNIMKKDTKTIRKNQSEMKDTLTEMKNNLQGIKSRVDEAKNQISDLAHREAKKKHHSEQQKEKLTPKHVESVRSLWDNFKDANISIMGCQRESKKLKTF